MDWIEILKAIVLGIVQGITEWLPISSTGHMILVDEFLKMHMSAAFKEMFLVVVQFGSILAVVVLYWRRLLPFATRANRLVWDKNILILWTKIIVACVPAGIIGILFDELMDKLFYNYQTVAVTLILYGIVFIIVENYNKHRSPRIKDLSQMTYRTAFMIGVFQVLSLIPGTSRSGSTIIGGMILGASRTVAAEFTFFVAIPIMFGASLLKLLKFGLAFTGEELTILLVGMVVAFVVSVLAIKFLMGYIKKHNFKVFGWYRIVLGILVIGYFFFSK